MPLLNALRVVLGDAARSAVFVMIASQVIIDLAYLVATANVYEAFNGVTKAVSYEIRLYGESEARYTRIVLGPTGEELSKEVLECSITRLSNDPAFSPVVTWLARGIGGIPQEVVKYNARGINAST